MKQNNGHKQLCLFPPEGASLKGISGEIRAELINLLSRLMISVLERAAESEEEENQEEVENNG